ncbi:DUF58 domain-containing protein [Demequina lignilytica]|uniref:DUF58 domain-containing protein n=1 Tax=Demequina lignilytica TaxID=3051663 RepID=A0AB35MJN4_9MICO|nr:DUF58 domain-containing protein [Demequina sp. SYSU T0a273]MDN4483973.1 DUF58 domain-containing protein [Demequina sp. SYSU T0a273]
MTAGARTDAGGRSLFVTTRGIGMTASAAAVTVLGVGIASRPLVLVGAAMIGAVLVAVAWILVSVWGARRALSAVERTVSPPTLAVGGRGAVEVRVGAHRALARTLALREQAASELTGDTPVRATVARSRDEIRLRYPLAPVQRGRWALGPAIARTLDPFGLVEVELEIGGAHRIAVWPAVDDLAASAGDLMAVSDRAHAGARTPATDDAALRDYRDGDDLRRIHWRSSARRGELLVRSEEQQGRTEATVLVGLPPDPTALEWAIRAAASVSLSVLDAGHPVRLIAGGATASAHGTVARAAETARAAILDAMVDLHGAPSAAAAERDVATGAELIEAGPGAVTVAIVEPLGATALAALEPHGDLGRAWALVRGYDRDRLRAQRTADALRAAGWRVVVTTAPESVPDAWSRLLAEAQP